MKLGQAPFFAAWASLAHQELAVGEDVERLGGGRPRAIDFRLISATHLAHSSTRVMRTGGAIGQAVGLAAALCLERGILPADLARDAELMPLVRELAERHIRCVVVEKKEENLLALALEDLPVHVPALCGDALDSSVLLAAGLKHRHCAGVIALTDNDHINLTIAITSKLLAPDLQVICRSESHDSEANMASFGTDHIINPYDTFAERFAMMFQSPSMYLLYEWMTSLRENPLTDFSSPPRGEWILCGYGRFGQAVPAACPLRWCRCRPIIR